MRTIFIPMTEGGYVRINDAATYAGETRMNRFNSTYLSIYFGYTSSHVRR